MPMFRVSLHRRILGPNHRGRNPFLAQLPADGVTVKMSVRSWTFEAKDEAEVKRLLQEAYTAHIAGYTLRSIERLPGTEGSDTGEAHGR